MLDVLASDDPDATLLRFVRARKFDPMRAIPMLIDALRWRRQVKLREFNDMGESMLKPHLLANPTLYMWGSDLMGYPVW
jgi:hypothetical protein